MLIRHRDGIQPACAIQDNTNCKFFSGFDEICHYTLNFLTTSLASLDHSPPKCASNAQKHLQPVGTSHFHCCCVFFSSSFSLEMWKLIYHSIVMYGAVMLIIILIIVHRATCFSHGLLFLVFFNDFFFVFIIRVYFNVHRKLEMRIYR